MIFRENEMGAKLIVEMDGKKTSLLKPSRHSAISRGESSNDFTFDYSYWSYDSRDEHYATQDQVFDDLGTDVVDCAFQGKLIYMSSKFTGYRENT